MATPHFCINPSFSGLSPLSSKIFGTPQMTQFFEGPTSPAPQLCACTWKCIQVVGCHLLQQMSSQWGSQKLLQGLVSHEFTAFPSIFNLFKLNELWPYYQKHVNQIILNRTTLWSLALRIFEAFIRILLIVNLSLNQTLLTFLLCVRQTWMTQLIMAICLWEVILLHSKRILVLICMVSQFMLKKDFLLHRTYL